jgi:hypothetical protein
MKPLKRILYLFFFLLVVLISCSALLTLFYLYTYLFRNFGEVIVVVASLVTFVWLANLAENSRLFQRFKNWFWI